MRPIGRIVQEEQPGVLPRMDNVLVAEIAEAIFMDVGRST
jgi:hypothetical protein